MRKIILDLAVTLDGFIEGPNGEIDWIVADGITDFADILNKILVDIDTIFYGRISYELWGNYQPPESAGEKLKEAYRLLHSKQKYVFSTTAKQDHSDAAFINSDIRKNVMEILKQPGKNIWLYGGGKLTTTFINLGLIDVYRLAVHPVILGNGKPLFKGIKERVRLKNANTTVSQSGVVLLTYEAHQAETKQVLFIQGGGNGGYEADEKLVVSLREALGTGYNVNYPRMLSDETVSDFGQQWLKQIDKEISSVKAEVILAGHSLGASMLLKYLSENKIKENISGIFLIAPPFWSGTEDWVQPLKLQEGFSDKLPKDIPIFFYQCKDDEVVPFDHFTAYRQNLPWAGFREIAQGGHQFNNDLSPVAKDIKTLGGVKGGQAGR